MIGIGIDIGSTATKAVVANDTGDIAEKLVMPTGFSSVEAADEVAKRLQQAGYNANELPVVATGYGRIAVPYANKVVTEITCHARGAWALFADDGTVVDVGGQDTKAIGLAAGKVRKFVMNDKCSAGTGRFLEIMADRLGVSQQELARLAAAGQPTVISNMSTVFAESEVVSLIAQNKAPDDIVHGLNKAVAAKTAALVQRVGGEEKYMMTGGVSKNQGLVQTLEEKLSTKLVISENAQLCGALGAALYAADMIAQ